MNRLKISYFLVSVLVLSFSFAQAQGTTKLFPIKSTPRQIVSKLFNATWKASDGKFYSNDIKKRRLVAYYSLDTFFRFRSGGKECLLLVVHQNDDGADCHGCSVTVNQIQLIKSSDGSSWQVDFIGGGISSGAWGLPGDFSLLQLDKNNWGLLIYDYFMGQGHSTKSVQIYYKTNKLLELNIEEDNGGAVGADDPLYFSYDTEMTVNIDSGTLTFVRAGTILVSQNDADSKVVDAKNITSYRFVNGKLVKL